MLYSSTSHSCQVTWNVALYVRQFTVLYVHVDKMCPRQIVLLSTTIMLDAASVKHSCLWCDCCKLASDRDVICCSGCRHQRPPCNNDLDAGSLLGCHNAPVRSHNVMPSDAIMIRVMTDAPTKDHVAIWYSMRGRGVGSGVVVTNTTIILYSGTDTMHSMW